MRKDNGKHETAEGKHDKVRKKGKHDEERKDNMRSRKKT